MLFVQKILMVCQRTIIIIQDLSSLFGPVCNWRTIIEAVIFLREITVTRVQGVNGDPRHYGMKGSSTFTSEL